MTIDPYDIAVCTEIEADAGAGWSPAAPPIVQTSLFTYPTFEALLDAFAAEHKNRLYTRGQNPTVEILERKLAALERGEACKVFASGMAAVSAVILGLLRAGDHILFVNQTYGPTLQLAERMRRFGIEHDLLLDTDVDSVARALRPNTKLVWLESPGTMTFRMLDVPAIAALARDHGALTCIDNSWATPLFQKPITFGVDLVVHSATKYIGGHSDVVAGAVITTAERMEELFYGAFLLNGGILSPFDAWLLLRGLRTLPVRMKQHHEDALRVAEFLAGHPAVRRVHHPAFTEDRELAERQLTGYSGLFSFDLVRDDFDSVARVINSLRRFHIGVSWGGFESLVISPRRRGNEAYLDRRRIPRGLIRISVGLEGADALIEDLAQALEGVA